MLFLQSRPVAPGAKFNLGLDPCGVLGSRSLRRLATLGTAQRVGDSRLRTFHIRLGLDRLGQRMKNPPAEASGFSFLEATASVAGVASSAAARRLD
jgi:hypothetical protein